MSLFRPQFTLRTLFAIMTLCAIVAASVECETVASRRFSSKEVVIEASMGTLLLQIDRELYRNWVKDQEANNLKFAAWAQKEGFRSWKHPEKAIVDQVGSQEGP